MHTSAKARLTSAAFWRISMSSRFVTCYLLLVVVGLEKLDALNAPLFTTVELILEHVDRLRHDH